MTTDAATIKVIIEKIPFVIDVADFEKEGFAIKGKVKLMFKGLNNPLDFNLEIDPQYPLRSYDSESIKFKNTELLKYQHVMGDGSICIHTSHNTNLEQKLLIDFSSLKNWIIRYYLNDESDIHYEHIIVPEKLFEGQYYSFCFTDVAKKFNNNEFGSVSISTLSPGVYRDKPILNYLVQGFVDQNQKKTKCKWSSQYSNSPSQTTGIYFFMDKPPAALERFVFSDWDNFSAIFPESFLAFLHQFEKLNSKKFRGQNTPLFIGYPTVSDEIHWLVTNMKIGDFPIEGVPVKLDGKKTGKWKSEMKNGKIDWAISINASYKYFFGRGALSKNITKKNILVLGIGAIGSIIAKTLARGGCHRVDLADFDVKLPENICRSEYFFNLGLNDKVDELSRILMAISPFVETTTIKKDYFQYIIKLFHDDKKLKAEIVSELNRYDIIFDCSTDDDLMYVLDKLELNCTIINLSITNKARDLVCGFSPNLYRFVKNQYNDILTNDVDDLYNPTGCWSPTFKASYNDVDFLVQFALKHINRIYSANKNVNSFVIKALQGNEFNPILEEY